MFTKSDSPVAIIKVSKKDECYLVMPRDPDPRGGAHKVLAVDRHTIKRIDTSHFPLAEHVTPTAIAEADELGSNDPRMYWEESTYIPASSNTAIMRPNVEAVYEHLMNDGGDMAHLFTQDDRLYRIHSYGGLPAVAITVGLSEVGISRGDLSKRENLSFRTSSTYSPDDEFVNPRGLYIAARELALNSPVQRRDIDPVTGRFSKKRTKQERNAINGLAAVIASATRGMIEQEDPRVASLEAGMPKRETAELLGAAHDYLQRIHWASILRIDFEIKKDKKVPFESILGFIEMLDSGYDAELVYQYVYAKFYEPAIVAKMIDENIDIDFARQLTDD